MGRDHGYVDAGGPQQNRSLAEQRQAVRDALVAAAPTNRLRLKPPANVVGNADAGQGGASRSRSRYAECSLALFISGRSSPRSSRSSSCWLAWSRCARADRAIPDDHPGAGDRQTTYAGADSQTLADRSPHRSRRRSTASTTCCT
jgi:hypothetical protein